MNKYLKSLSQELHQGDYEEALMTLGEYAWAEAGAGNSDLGQLLRKHKKGLMQELLRTMQRLSSDEIHYWIPLVIAGLRRAGATWDELNVIERSVHQDMKQHDTIDEAYRESPGMMAHYAGVIKHSLAQKRDWQVGYDFQKLGNIDTAQVYDALKPLAADLAAWYTRLVGSDELGGIPAVHSLWRAWTYMGKLYPELRKAVRDSKLAVMRAMLHAIRLDRDGGNLEQVRHVLRELEQMGIDWPEMRIIQQSLDNDTERQRRAAVQDLQQG